VEGIDVKVATGREFYECFGAASEAIEPNMEWSLMEADGSWSRPPDDCDTIVLADDVYTREFMEITAALPAPRWAHTEDAGTDGFFYDAMRDKGAIVTHSPGANAPEVAEFAFSFLLWSAKRLGEFRDSQRAHAWDKRECQGLSDKTVLVIGLGAIGSHVVRYAKAFGMQVLGIRRSVSPAADVDRQGTLDDLEDFLAEADFVVLALPHSGDTDKLIGTAELARMKPGAALINVARGALVDLPSLTQALASGQLHQACLDVLPTEPWPADSDLWDLPNLFMTPHNASDSPLYLPRVGKIWLENLRRFQAGEALLHRAF
jgi:phosphoglycerate dehydrogenase-like enzyme